MCMYTHLNLSRRETALVASGIAEVMQHDPFLFFVSNFAKRKTHLPKTMILAPRSQSVTCLKTTRNK